MNKQYLKSLQQRAQRLLEISSDEGSELENFQLSKTKSRRVDLNEVLSGTDLNQLKTQFQDYRNTDVQLLKKCINMTNQNSQLKRQLKSFQTENNQLKAQNIFLQKQLQNFKSELMKVRQKLSIKNNQDDSPYNRLEEIDHFSFISKSPHEEMRQKSMSAYKVSSFKSNKTGQQSRYTEQIHRAQERYKKEISELEQRLKVSNQKKEKIEQTLIKEKEKSRKLFKFINQQIPQLRDIVIKLTNKVDIQVESLLLKDINQNEFDMNFHKNRSNRKPY